MNTVSAPNSTPEHNSETRALVHVFGHCKSCFTTLIPAPLKLRPEVSSRAAGTRRPWRDPRATALLADKRGELTAACNEDESADSKDKNDEKDDVHNEGRQARFGKQIRRVP
ncbi:hypothetical protein MTO96_040385 [Rhipicephalus appendiculatus]